MKTWSKPGYRTTEFFGASILSILSMIKGLPLPSWTAPLVWGLYVVARGMSKMGGAEIDDEIIPPGYSKDSIQDKIDKYGPDLPPLPSDMKLYNNSGITTAIKKSGKGKNILYKKEPDKKKSPQ